jgi:hypothetical protein
MTEIVKAVMRHGGLANKPIMLTGWTSMKEWTDWRGKTVTWNERAVG